MNCRTTARPLRRRRCGWAAAAASLLVFAAFVQAQSSKPSDSSQKTAETEQVAVVHPTEGVRPNEAVLPATEPKAVAVNPVAVLKQELTDDNARLLELATELKSAVDQSNPNTLSVQVIRKAESIQKLAKGCKQKIKLAEGAG